MNENDLGRTILTRFEFLCSMRSRLNSLTIIIIMLTCSMELFSQIDCDCKNALEETQQEIEISYAGYDYYLNLNGENNYNQLINKLIEDAKAISNLKDCESLLKRLINFFNDKHLNIVDDNLRQRLDSSTTSPEFKTYKSGKIAYLKIPSFDLEFKSSIDSLLRVNHKDILQSTVFVIDLSNNEGGSDDSYSSLTPYYYDRPITVEGVDLLASDGNISELEKYLTYTDYFDDETLESIRNWVDKGNRNKGSFVTVEPESTIELDSIFNVPNIAMIITNAKSAAEGIILEALQSENVTTFGQNSGGARDFLNVRHQELKHCSITIGLPMTKSTRVPENGIDGIGIEPKVTESLDAPIEWVEFIYKYYNLKKR